MTATVTYEFVKVAAKADDSGIAWTTVHSVTDDVVGFGGWAEQTTDPNAAVSPANPDTAYKQFGTNAHVGLPLVGTALDTDPVGSPGEVWLCAGFQCTPHTWLAAHLWIARVS